MHVGFLLTYSPNLDPIEEGFLAMKLWIRCNCDYAFGELLGIAAANPYHLPWQAVFGTLTPDNILGWYCHSGYVQWDYSVERVEYRYIQNENTGFTSSM
ncbi:hypothetical protein BC835DRAFT_1292897 [Cytidiella melzeri]|nr:hypothetical protein BC835DRAFT_1292897 [Cytidiella melzeri]